MIRRLVPFLALIWTAAPAVAQAPVRIGLSAPLYSAISAVAVAIAGLVAVILHEKKPAA